MSDMAGCRAAIAVDVCLCVCALPSVEFMFSQSCPGTRTLEPACISPAPFMLGCLFLLPG